uniref:oleoyl-[acyl-carrier-protein] hydrolase n=1 Tax=Timema bartmani TaxID=61472 RepID=A0A7R9F1W2_9NEOP|nr:unnamed protein product [Timema bartmani]
MDFSEFYQYLVVLAFKDKESLGFTLSIQKGTGDFEIFENKRPLVTGQIRIPENAAAEFSKNISVPSEDSTNLTGEDVYSELKHRGYHYSGQFKGILNAQIGNEGSTAVIEWSNDWLLFLDSLIQLAILHKGEDSQQMQLPLSFQKVIIDPSRHPVEREQKAVYQKFSNILTCGGVEIRGIELFKLTTENYNNIKLDTFRFLSHNNPQLKCSLSAKYWMVYGCYKLLIENHAMTLYDRIEIIEMISKEVTSSLGPRVNAIFKSYPRVKFQLNTVFSEKILQLNKDKHISLILANEDTAKQAASIIKGEFLLARFETSQELIFGQELIVIVQQQFEDGYWVLLKKPVPVNDRSSVIHLSTEALVSPGQLRSSLSVGKDNGTKVYVVAQNQNLQDVETFVTHIYKNLKSEHARYVFVLDQSSTTFSPTGRLFLDQLSQDLTVNVYFNGSWGSLRHLPLLQSTAPKPGTLQKLRPYLSLKDWDLSFASLNYEDWCLNRSRSELGLPPDIGVMDLSGWSPEGRRVMALAHKEEPNIHFKTTPHLTWSIPDSWSLEDAATVPLPYAMAYYGLVLKAAVKATESILVHGGHSSMGQAFLAAAIQLELVPYTTVTNTQQKEFIRIRFPQILESNIHNIYDTQLPMNIMKETKGKGIDIIVNCLQGQIIQSYINCLAYYGRFLNLCMADMQQNQILGMQFFLRNTGFFGVLPDHLFDINPSWCEWLHSLVKKGIDSGVVKPFARKVFTFFQEDEALRTLNDDDYNGRVLINIKNKQDFQKRNFELVQNEISLKFIFNPEKSCIIVGGRPEDCLNIVEWLSIRGARLFTICSHNRPTSVLIKRRASLLCSYYHARINIVPTDKTTSLQGTKQLIQEATSTAPLGFICAVSMLHRFQFKILSTSQTKKSKIQMKNKHFCGAEILHPSVMENRLLQAYSYRVEHKKAFYKLTKEMFVKNTALMKTIKWFGITLKVILNSFFHQDNYSSLHNLDVASRNVASLAHFVSLLNPGTENVSKARRKAGLPIVDIQWSEYQKNNEMSRVLVALDVLLNRTQPDSVVFISLGETKTQYIQHVSEGNLSLLLPYSLKDFEKLSEELADKESNLLVEVSSLSPGLNIVQEVPPIYFIPGLQSSTKELLEPLSKNLMYPTLGVRIPGGQLSIHDIVTQVSKSIRAVQKDGPYNIVGASWGAIVAMELARELEDQGQKTQLFILDGAPETTQSMARQLGEGHQLQVNLLTRLLNITSNKVYEELIRLSSWEDRLCRSLMEVNSLRPEMKQSLSEAVNTVYHRVNQLLEYKPHESLLQGHISLIRPKGSKDDDNLGLDKGESPLAIVIYHFNLCSFLLEQLLGCILWPLTWFLESSLRNPPFLRAVEKKPIISSHRSPRTPMKRVFEAAANLFVRVIPIDS